MRIAFLTSEYVTEANFAGGLAQYLGRVTSGLVGRGHDVEVFVISNTCEKIEHKGVTVRRVKPKPWLPLRSANLVFRMIRMRRLSRLQAACSTALGLNDALCKRLAKAGFDIAQAASWMATGFFAAANPRVPLIVRASSFEPLLFPYRGKRLSLDEKMYCRLEAAAMRRAAAVYAPSRFMAKEILRISGIKAHVVSPPFCGLDYPAEERTNEQLGDWSDFVIFFGKVAKYKGAGLLAEAVKPLLRQDPQLRLAIAGPVEDDPEARKLLSLAETHFRSVRYLGSLPHDELMAVVKKASVVVLPSLMDNLPNTCLEAMAMSKVVIGPNGVSFDELITDGQSGFLFQKGNLLSLQQAILKACNLTKDKRIAIGRSAKARIQRMAPEITLAALESFYESIIENTRTSGCQSIA